MTDSTLREALERIRTELDSDRRWPQAVHAITEIIEQALASEPQPQAEPLSADTLEVIRGTYSDEAVGRTIRHRDRMGTLYATPSADQPPARSTATHDYSLELRRIMSDFTHGNNDAGGTIANLESLAEELIRERALSPDGRDAARWRWLRSQFDLPESEMAELRDPDSAEQADLIIDEAMDAKLRSSK